MESLAEPTVSVQELKILLDDADMVTNNANGSVCGKFCLITNPVPAFHPEHLHPQNFFECILITCIYKMYREQMSNELFFVPEKMYSWVQKKNLDVM